jgi:hypothetical protein
MDYITHCVYPIACIRERYAAQVLVFTDLSKRTARAVRLSSWGFYCMLDGIMWDKEFCTDYFGTDFVACRVSVALPVSGCCVHVRCYFRFLDVADEVAVHRVIGRKF